MSNTTETTDNTYIPSPSKLNSDMISSWLPGTPPSVIGSANSSPQSVDSAELEGEHVIYKERHGGNYYLKTNYRLPRRIFKEPEDVSVVRASDMQSVVVNMNNNLFDTRWIKVLRMYVSNNITNLKEWIVNNVYKLHESWVQTIDE